MPRLRLRRQRSDSRKQPGPASLRILIVGGPLGAAGLTYGYPDVALPLNVGAAVLGTLYAITSGSARAERADERGSDGDEDVSDGGCRS